MLDRKLEWPALSLGGWASDRCSVLTTKTNPTVSLNKRVQNHHSLTIHRDRLPTLVDDEVVEPLRAVGKETRNDLVKMVLPESRRHDSSAPMPYRTDFASSGDWNQIHAPM